MKIVKFIFPVGFLFLNSAYSFVFQGHPTICRPDILSQIPLCYNVGLNETGYNFDALDQSAKCKGKKIICEKAIVKAGNFGDQALSKNEIENNSIVSKFFDTNILNNDCFGVRKRDSSGLYAQTDKGNVKIWCKDVLDNPDEEFLSGSIVLDVSNQPKCSDLAQKNIIDIQNANCFGKKLKERYHLVCDSANKNAEYIIDDNGDKTLIDDSFLQKITVKEINAKFENMKEAAKKARG